MNPMHREAWIIHCPYKARELSAARWDPCLNRTDGRSWSIHVQIDVVRCMLYIHIVHLIKFFVLQIGTTYIDDLDSRLFRILAS